jgi:hypothetical protein
VSLIESAGKRDQDTANIGVRSRGAELPGRTKIENPKSNINNQISNSEKQSDPIPKPI